MAAVVFAFGSRTGLAAHEAEDIAAVLAAERNLAAQSAATKIREQAELDPTREVSHDVELDQDELKQLAAVLETMRSKTDFRVSLGRLHADVAAALGH
jgi:alpha/beta superfamily hydrolase